MKYTIRKSFYQIYALGTIKIIFIKIKLSYKWVFVSGGLEKSISSQKKVNFFNRKVSIFEKKRCLKYLLPFNVHKWDFQAKLNFGEYPKIDELQNQMMRHLNFFWRTKKTKVLTKYFSFGLNLANVCLKSKF